MKRQWVKFPWDLFWENETYKLKRSIMLNIDLINHNLVVPQGRVGEDLGWLDSCLLSFTCFKLFTLFSLLITVSTFSNCTCIQIIKHSESNVSYCLTCLFWRVLAWNKSMKCFHHQGSCRVLTHLSKKTAKLNRSAVDQGKSKAILPVIPVDETDRRRALYTGNAS